MRLIVAHGRAHQQYLARQHPDDKVVCVGDALYGIRVTEIVDETDPNWPWSDEELAWALEWWGYAQCRVG